MTEITVRPMSRAGCQDPFIVAMLIAKSQGLDIRETLVLLKLRKMESFLSEDHPQLSVTIACDEDNVPVGAATRHRLDVFKDCKHSVEVYLRLFVPDCGDAVTGTPWTLQELVRDELTTAARAQSRNEGVKGLWFDGIHYDLT